MVKDQFIILTKAHLMEFFQMIKKKEKDVLSLIKELLSKGYGSKEKYLKNFELFFTNKRIFE